MKNKSYFYIHFILISHVYFRQHTRVSLHRYNGTPEIIAHKKVSFQFISPRFVGILYQKVIIKSMVMHAFNSCTHEAEANESL